MKVTRYAYLLFRRDEDTAEPSSAEATEGSVTEESAYGATRDLTCEAGS